MEEFYNKYVAGYSTSPELTINFYNENLLFFNNISYFKNARELTLFLEVYYRCITAFINKKQYKNALTALKPLPVIEKAIDEFKIDRADFNLYKWLLTQKATALCYLKDYSASKSLFKTLQIYDPENDNVKMWIEHCWMKQIEKYILVPLVIAWIIIIGQRVSKTPNIIIYHICTYISVACVLIYFIMYVYIQRKRNKKT